MFMPIIGRTSEGSHIYLPITLLKCAIIGRQEILLVSTKMAVRCKAIVAVVMAGRNKFSIHWFTKRFPAMTHSSNIQTKSRVNARKIYNVVIFILQKTTAHQILMTWIQKSYSHLNWIKLMPKTHIIQLL